MNHHYLHLGFMESRIQKFSDQHESKLNSPETVNVEKENLIGNEAEGLADVTLPSNFPYT
jgi:hypothetical protein